MWKIISMKNIFSIFIVFLIIYLVPFLIYGIFSEFLNMQIPAGTTPFTFLLSIFISKSGTAVAFVFIYFYSRNDLKGKWIQYAFFWWILFVSGESGQLFMPDYTWKETVAGIISESIYCFAAAYFLEIYIGLKS